MSDIFSNIEVPYQTANSGQKDSTTQKATPVNETKQVSVKDALPASSTVDEAKTDTVELSTNDKNEKKGPVKKVKGFIAGIKKFFASSGEYIKGTAKGIASGAVAGSLIYTGGNIINHFKAKGVQEAGQKIKKIPNKALAVGAAVIAVAANLWTASLNATERKSNIDHRWIGHQNNNS